jgi:D-glycerate 3-kinase
MPEIPQTWQKEFLHSHQLGATYLPLAEKWFDPLAAKLAAGHAKISRPILLAVNGSQGSGKSTLTDYLVAELQEKHQLKAVALSLDDFYYTKAERSLLAQTIHPLLATRGVPGTHDIALLGKTLDALLEDGKGTDQTTVVNIPRFNKATDERFPGSIWDIIEGAVDIVILEGWCLGVRPESKQQLERPVNILEECEDPKGVWRSYVNDTIRKQFLPLYHRVDHWLMLQAPSFNCVYRWRLEQEQKLASKQPLGASLKVMNEVEISRFIQYYQRLTERCLADLPDTVNYLFQLDENRNIIKSKFREGIQV